LSLLLLSLGAARSGDTVAQSLCSAGEGLCYGDLVALENIRRASTPSPQEEVRVVRRRDCRRVRQAIHRSGVTELMA
jgi:hypothetical protein